MTKDLRRTTYRLSTAWGIIWLALGYGAGFTIGANDTTASLVGFFLVFAVPIVASVAARWFPRVVGFALILAAIVCLIGIYAKGGMADVLHALATPYLWFHVLFGIAFVVLANEINTENAAGGPPVK